MVIRLFIALFILSTSSPLFARIPHWHLFFCLPYDNDLAVHGAFIQSEISSHVSSGKVEVTLLIQSPEGEITFNHFAADTAFSELSEQSVFSNGVALEQFLNWSENRVEKKKRKAFFMLGHGGGVNKIALEASKDSTWTSTHVFANVLEAYASEYGAFDFVFLQQCVKATVADYFELEHVADWIVASPLPIGAPNFYYASVLDSLSVGALKRPRQLINACIREDRLEMSEVWSIIDADRFANWLRYLNAYPPQLDARNLGQGLPMEYDPSFFGGLSEVRYAGETYWELEAWLGFQRSRGYWSAANYGEVYSGYLRAVDTIDRFTSRDNLIAAPAQAFQRTWPQISGVVLRGAMKDSKREMRFYQECPNLLPFLAPLDQWPQ